MTTDKIVVVKKATELEELLKRYSTTSQVKFYLESRGHSYEFYKQGHDTYKEGMRKTIALLPKTMRTQVIDKEHLDTFQTGNKDLIVTIGDAGMLVNVAKYVGEQPIIAVNPDSNRNDNVLASCDVKGFPQMLKTALEGSADYETLTMAEAVLDNGERILAINDLFVGKNNHTSARYEIQQRRQKEYQSSDGIIVSTGTGSTGWLTSIVSQVNAMSGGRYNGPAVPFNRDYDYLMFAVRSPFPSNIARTHQVYGKVTQNNPLTIISKMPEDGVIFSDGILTDYLEFNAGRTATIKPSKNKVYLARR